MRNDHIPQAHSRDLTLNGMSALCVLLCLAWILPGLLGHDPWKPDEAQTFGLVYHLLQGGSWIVPTLAGEPYIDKPPLFVLSAALTAKLVSSILPLHDGARIASGIYMAVALALIAATGRLLYGGQRGWVAALLVIGCLGLVVRAHQLIADTALFAGMAAGCYGLALMLQRPRAGGLVLGTGAGVAFMAKGLTGPVCLALACTCLIAFCSPWRSRKTVGAALLALAAATPWFIAWPIALHATAPGLLSEWFWNAGVGRLLGQAPLSLRAEQLGYLAILPWYAFPALPLALWVLWGTRVSKFARAQIQLPVVVLLCSLLVLSLPGDTREVYAMPMLIPIGLLATPAFDNMRRGTSNAMYWFGVMGFTFFAAVAWFYWCALELGVPARLSTHLHKLQPAYDSHVRWGALGVGVLYSVGWALLLCLLRRTMERPVIVWAGGTTLIWGLLMSLFVAYADASKSYRSVIEDLVRSLPAASDCISSRALGEPQRAMLHYHAGIITLREEVPARQRACELLLLQGRRSEPPEIPPGWHQIWEGTRPGEKDEYFWLYGYGPPPSVH